MRTEDGKPRLLRSRLRLASGTFLTMFIGLAAGVQPTRADTSLVNNTTVIRGPIQVRLSFTDQNGAAQDVSLLSLPPSLTNVLPNNLTKLRQSPLLVAPGNGKGYFDQAWQQTQNATCGEVAAEIGQQVNSSANKAYNVTCTPNPLGALLATIANQWQDLSRFTITGTRLTLDYWIPYNNSVFSVTSPTTCKEANLVCAADPQYTVLFDTHLSLAFSTPNVQTLPSLPSNQAAGGEVIAQDVSQGDNSGAVKASLSAWFAGTRCSVRGRFGGRPAWRGVERGGPDSPDRSVGGPTRWSRGCGRSERAFEGYHFGGAAARFAIGGRCRRCRVGAVHFAVPGTGCSSIRRFLNAQRDSRSGW